MFQRALTSVVAIAAMLLTSTVAKADFVIDTFTSPTPATTYTLGNTSGSIYSSGPQVVGAATRNITVTQVGNVTIPANGFFGTSLFDGPAFQLNTSNSSIGSATYAKLNYTYGTAQNLAVGGPVLKFSFDALQTAAPFSVVLNGNTAGAQTGVVAVSNASSTFSFPLAGFSGVDLTAVTSIDLYVNSNVTTSTSASDADITLRDVRVTQNTSVPAPPAALLLLAAAPAFGFARLARRKAAL